MAVDYAPDMIDVAVASLDAPASTPPAFHIFTEDALGWVRIDDLPSYARFRPESTRAG